MGGEPGKKCVECGKRVPCFIWIEGKPTCRECVYKKDGYQRPADVEARLAELERLAKAYFGLDGVARSPEENMEARVELIDFLKGGPQ